MVFSTSWMSPSFLRKVCAISSTKAGGGSSDTNRVASLVLMKCAVDG